MMEVDYYRVLGVSKYSKRKEISEKYRALQRSSATADERRCLDRALLVLRVSYLKYVFDTRGEGGLQEPRSVQTISRGMTALAHVRSSHYYRTVKRKLDAASPQSYVTRSLMNGVLQDKSPPHQDDGSYVKSAQNHMDHASRSIIHHKKSPRSSTSLPKSLISHTSKGEKCYGSPLSYANRSSVKNHDTHHKNESPKSYKSRSSICSVEGHENSPHHSLTYSPKYQVKSTISRVNCSTMNQENSPQTCRSKLKSVICYKNSPQNNVKSPTSNTSNSTHSNVTFHLKLPAGHMTDSNSTADSSSSSSSRDDTTLRRHGVTSDPDKTDTKVNKWLDGAWNQGLLLSHVSSSTVKEKSTSKYRYRDENTPHRVMHDDLHVCCPSRRQHRESQRLPWSRDHQEPRYGVHRPVDHVTQHQASSTMRLLIQK